jgi:hypothetical protein
MWAKNYFLKLFFFNPGPFQGGHLGGGGGGNLFERIDLKPITLNLQAAQVPKKRVVLS